MSFEARTRRLEKLAGSGRDAPCQECGGRIPSVVHWPEDETSYPFGEPCGSCEGPPGIRVIEIVMEGDDGN